MLFVGGFEEATVSLLNSCACLHNQRNRNLLTELCYFYSRNISALLRLKQWMYYYVPSGSLSSSFTTWCGRKSIPWALEHNVQVLAGEATLAELRSAMVKRVCMWILWIFWILWENSSFSHFSGKNVVLFWGFSGEASFISLLVACAKRNQNVRKW